MKLTSKEKFLVNKTRKNLGITDNYYIDKHDDILELVYIKRNDLNSIDKLYRVNVRGDK